jgi:hypothetical protein
MSKYPDQEENLNPIPEAVIAMTLYSSEYSKQSGGSMDFYKSLNPARQRQCAELLNRVKQSMVNHNYCLHKSDYDLETEENLEA